ncbi:uncharacterized protein L969DRAFT_91579 [Mixia osmundae IAM 14324]|uniref:uncharacterized protein n=1 Tax=Mixia osmundae (strain CBS 9802 / IAM 14324 / JCM 22182 / KY 12970) TaxID=764103 RepID=UPI0004A5510B|nr:uncharacterized protein L969DRAFT_91579 [Mixia osmundae IAM 14324]KEI42116.1 hypothetical protein L969DRAFT_91579 [Mixia osmundae IAM 14324]
MVLCRVAKVVATKLEADEISRLNSRGNLVEQTVIGRCMRSAFESYILRLTGDGKAELKGAPVQPELAHDYGSASWTSSEPVNATGAMANSFLSSQSGLSDDSMFSSNSERSSVADDEPCSPATEEEEESTLLEDGHPSACYQYQCQPASASASHSRFDSRQTSRTSEVSTDTDASFDEELLGSMSWLDVAAPASSSASRWQIAFRSTQDQGFMRSHPSQHACMSPPKRRTSTVTEKITIDPRVSPLHARRRERDSREQVRQPSPTRPAQPKRRTSNGRRFLQLFAGKGFTSKAEPDVQRIPSEKSIFPRRQSLVESKRTNEKSAANSSSSLLTRSINSIRSVPNMLSSAPVQHADWHKFAQDLDESEGVDEHPRPTSPGELPWPRLSLLKGTSSNGEVASSSVQLQTFAFSPSAPQKAILPLAKPRPSGVQPTSSAIACIPPPPSVHDIVSEISEIELIADDAEPVPDEQPIVRFLANSSHLRMLTLEFEMMRHRKIVAPLRGRAVTIVVAPRRKHAQSTSANARAPYASPGPSTLRLVIC